jgi:AAA family ATP:ADP antiporter
MRVNSNKRVQDREETPQTDVSRILWLSSILFVILGGYWLLRSLKDPIMSAISGIEYIPQAKVVSLFLSFLLVAVYNKLLDLMPKHKLFYLMGLAFGTLFTIIGIILMHPTLGLSNTSPSPCRLLGWISYCSIESFGSLVVQAYWAIVNANVDVHFAKQNFGYIIAVAQIGSILGPTAATQAETFGIPFLFLGGAGCSFFVVLVMYLYIQEYGDDSDSNEHGTVESIKHLESNAPLLKQNAYETKTAKSDGGVLEAFVLLYRHNFVKGIFCISSLFMVNVTIMDYMLKLLITHRYEIEYANDPHASTQAFTTFMGYFGQVTNCVSFLFSLFGTKIFIQKLGFSKTLIAFPVLLLICTIVLWHSPNLWCVFFALIVIKGMSYALNNPTKEILYQCTSDPIKFKCKSWIDTFGQRSAKAVGSLIANAFTSSLYDLNNYGTLVGAILAIFLIWVSKAMGSKFEELQASGMKVSDNKGCK